jgi:hypothetical protein
MDGQPRTEKVEWIRSLILQGEYFIEARIVAEAIIKKDPLLARGRGQTLDSARILVLHRHPARHQQVSISAASRPSVRDVRHSFRLAQEKYIRQPSGRSNCYRAVTCNDERAA